MRKSLVFAYSVVHPVAPRTVTTTAQARNDRATTGSHATYVLPIVNEQKVEFSFAFFFCSAQSTGGFPGLLFCCSVAVRKKMGVKVIEFCWTNEEKMASIKST